VNPTAILVVGDLHMGAGHGDPFDHDAAFAAFLQTMAERRDGTGRPPRLVVLGDLFDLPAAGGGRHPEDEAAALERLERIAAAHPGVVAALGAYARSGGALDLVIGNHDADLVRPSVQARVRALLDAPVAFHPWILHVPGVLYAEHGHQHHDVCAFATPLAPWRPDHPGRLDLPAAVAHGPCAVALLARAGASPEMRARRAAYRESVLREAAPRLALSHAALCAIDAATPRGPLAFGARMARRATAAGRHPAAAQRRAAARIHGVLAAEARAVACYAFGHTHVAERRRLGPGPDAPVHVNAGTWSSLRPGGRPERLAYAEILPGPLGAAVRLVDWRGVRAAPRSRRRPARDRRETAPAPR
jgi:UDP-2,3-diacylglucosamine pyrophosphatase LpxH